MVSFDLVALEKVRAIVGRGCQIGNPIFPDSEIKSCVVDVFEFNRSSNRAYLVKQIKEKVVVVEKNKDELQDLLGENWKNRLEQSHKPVPWQKVASEK
jgi:NDP-sugar pyrophosphorylase family protein